MSTVTQDPDRFHIWHLELSNAEHNRLDALDNESGRLIASSASDALGLGRFQPLDTNDQGQPIGNTRWRTSHRNAEAEFIVLGQAIDDLLAPGNAASMAGIAAVITANRNDPEIPGLSEDEIAAQFDAARGG